MGGGTAPDEVRALVMADGGRCLRLLERLGFHLYDDLLHTEGESGNRSILEGLEEFREHLGGELTLAMPDQFGSQCDIHEVDHDLMKRCAQEVAERYA